MNHFIQTKKGLWLTAALCCLLWGSAFPAIKTGYRLFAIHSADTATIILFAGVRFFFAGVLTLLIFSSIERKPLLPKKENLLPIGALAVFQTVLQYILFYLGLAFTSGARGSVINASSVFFALFISAFIFKMERFEAHKLLGSLIGFGGVLLVSLDAFTSGGSVKGELFILGSSISYAFSSVFMKRFSEKASPAMLSGSQFILGGAVMVVASIAFGGRLTVINAKGLLLLLYMALLSAVAYSLWSILLRFHPVSSVAVCSFMTPVFGYFLSLLAERNGVKLSLYSLGALVLVVLGIVIVNYHKGNNPQSDAVK